MAEKRKIYKTITPITNLSRINAANRGVIIPKDAKWKIQLPGSKIRGQDATTTMVYGKTKGELRKALKEAEAIKYVKPLAPYNDPDHPDYKPFVPKKEKFDDVVDHTNLITRNKHFYDKQKDLEKHGFYKYVKAARGKGLTLEKFWRKCNPHDYRPYNNIKLLTELYEVYTAYKKENNICDFEDMVEDFNELAKDPQIDALIIDEAQDSNVPQLKATEKMARNVKDEHYYMVGDADQTIFEFSGSDADYFHKLSTHPFDELEEGKRCSVAVNEKCKQIIKPIWNKYGYSRVY